MLLPSLGGLVLGHLHTDDDITALTELNKNGA